MTRRRLRVVTEISDLLRDYDDAYLTCRDLHHHWRVIGYYRRGNEIRRQLNCERCGGVRVDRRLGGVRLSPSYAMPEGYRIPGGGVKPIHVWSERINRVNVYETEAAMVAELLEAGKKRSKHAK